MIKISIVENLIDIQSKLKVPKTNENKFGKYNYRSCEDILESIKPLLKENKVALVLNDEIVQEGDRIYIKATATLINDNGDKIEASAFAREGNEGRNGMTESQVTGATSSYARKYALNALFCIDDTKDDDNPVYATVEQINKIKELVEDIPKLLNYYKITKLEHLTRDVAQSIIDKKRK